MKGLLKKALIKIIQVLCKQESTLKHAGGKIEILVIRLDDIGDVVLMSPFLRELRQNNPQASITFVVKKSVYNLVEHCPYIDQVLVYQPTVKSPAFFRNIWRAWQFCRKYFSTQQADLVIVPRYDDDGYYASFLAFFSGARQRVAYSEHVTHVKEIQNTGYDGFFTDVIRTSDVKHEVERNLYVLQYLGMDIKHDTLETWIREEDQVPIESVCADCVTIAVFPCAGNRKREWDVSNYISVMKQLKEQYFIRFFLLGDSKNTAEATARIMEVMGGGVSNYVGKTTLRETIGILRRVDFYLGGDTGPMHLAAACKLPGVVISCHPRGAAIDHSNSPYRFGPWQDEMMMVLQPYALPGCEDGCVKNYAHCINQITVADVCHTLGILIENRVCKKNRK